MNNMIDLTASDQLRVRSCRIIAECRAEFQRFFPSIHAQAANALR